MMSCEEGVFLSSSKVSFEEGMRPSFEEDTLLSSSSGEAFLRGGDVPALAGGGHAPVLQVFREEGTFLSSGEAPFDEETLTLCGAGGYG